METPNTLLGDPITKDYSPSAYWGGYYALRKAPPFSLAIALEMLTDPRITLGLWLIKGPILSKTRFYVDCANTEVKEFLKKQVTRFWRSSSVKAMKAIEWGYGCSEALYHMEEGRIHFDTLKDLHSLDCRAITQSGKLVGASVRNVSAKNSRGKITIEGARCFWTIHGREIHNWYGRSRLFGAYLPWLELWSEGGCRDSRRLFYHKYAYGGEIGYVPLNMITLEDGSQVTARDFMREMLEKKKSGGIMVFPNTVNSTTGKYAWDVQDMRMPPPPTSISDYIQDLRVEILEGLGIPPEIVRAEGTGAYSGRAIPMEAFYSILQDLVNWLAHDLSTQILRPLVDVNFGPDIPFELVPFGLVFAPSTPSDQQDQAERQQGQMPTPNGEQYALDSNEIVIDSAPRGYRPKYEQPTVSLVV